MDVASGAARITPPSYSFSRRFWEGTRDKKLLLQFCPRTQQFQFYPRPSSIFTGHRDLEWREVEPAGEIYTFTISRPRPGSPPGTTPNIIVNVLLDAGVHILSNLVNCSLDDVTIGMRVTAFWEPLSDGGHLPFFQPAA